jgi:hypothetical protein
MQLLLANYKIPPGCAGLVHKTPVPMHFLKKTPRNFVLYAEKWQFIYLKSCTIFLCKKFKS